jgi:hypothetical protein
MNLKKHVKRLTCPQKQRLLTRLDPVALSDWRTHISPIAPTAPVNGTLRGSVTTQRSLRSLRVSGSDR